MDDCRYVNDIIYSHKSDSRGSTSRGKETSRPRDLSLNESRRSNSNSDRE